MPAAASQSPGTAPGAPLLRTGRPSAWRRQHSGAHSARPLPAAWHEAPVYIKRQYDPNCHVLMFCLSCWHNMDAAGMARSGRKCTTVTMVVVSGVYTLPNAVVVHITMCCTLTECEQAVQLHGMPESWPRNADCMTPTCGGTHDCTPGALTVGEVQAIQCVLPRHMTCGHACHTPTAMQPDKLHAACMNTC